MTDADQGRRKKAAPWWLWSLGLLLVLAVSVSLVYLNAGDNGRTTGLANGPAKRGSSGSNDPGAGGESSSSGQPGTSEESSGVDGQPYTSDSNPVAPGATGSAAGQPGVATSSAPGLQPSDVTTSSTSASTTSTSAVPVVNPTITSSPTTTVANSPTTTTDPPVPPSSTETPTTTEPPSSTGTATTPPPTSPSTGPTSTATTTEPTSPTTSPTPPPVIPIHMNVLVTDDHTIKATGTIPAPDGTYRVVFTDTDTDGQQWTYEAAFVRSSGVLQLPEGWSTGVLGIGVSATLTPNQFSRGDATLDQFTRRTIGGDEPISVTDGEGKWVGTVVDPRSPVPPSSSTSDSSSPSSTPSSSSSESTSPSSTPSDSSSPITTPSRTIGPPPPPVTPPGGRPTLNAAGHRD